MRGEPVDDVTELGVNRCRVADDAHSPAVEIVRFEEEIGAETDRHGAIIGCRFPFGPRVANRGDLVIGSSGFSSG
jgi:hypothetical protein